MVSYEFLLAYSAVLAIAIFGIVRILYNYTNKKFNKLYENMIDKHLFSVEHINKMQDQFIKILEKYKKLKEEISSNKVIDNIKKEKDIIDDDKEETTDQSAYVYRLYYGDDIYISRTDDINFDIDPAMMKLQEIRNYLCDNKRVNEIVRCVLVFPDQSNVDIDIREAIDMISIAIMRKGRGSQYILQKGTIYSVEHDDYQLISSSIEIEEFGKKALRIYCRKCNNNFTTVIPLTLSEYILIPDQYNNIDDSII